MSKKYLTNHREETMEHINHTRLSSRPFSILLFMVVVLFTQIQPVSAQVASPMQPGHWVPGIMGLRDFATPPPGLFALVYNWYLWSDTYIDRNGNDLKNFNLNDFNPELPDIQREFKLNGFATVPVLAWVSPFKILGGARYIAGIAPNYGVADFDVIIDPERGIVDPAHVHVEGSISGWSDLIVAPLGLTWAFGKFDGTGLFGEYGMSDEELAALGLPPQRRWNITFLYSFAAPTGRYETGASDNIGLGFWTHTFQGYASYYPFEPQATAIVAGLTYELNSKIKDVDVKPGDRLSLEWGVSQFVNEWLEFQIMFGHNWQISDDTGNDVYWDKSVYDKKSSVFFSAAFMPVLARFYIVAKYGYDFGIKQRFKNNHLVLNLYYATNLLTGK
jgi:hypothetical protein